MLPPGHQGQQENRMTMAHDEAVSVASVANGIHFNSSIQAVSAAPPEVHALWQSNTSTQDHELSIIIHQQQKWQGSSV